MMKKIISNLLLLTVTLFIVTSCDDKYPIIFDDSNVIVGMSNSTLSVKEDATGSFTIYLGGAEGTEATDVTLAVSVDGISKPAIEGTDFTLSTKNVNVPVGLASVTVTPVNNSIFTGNKQFKVTITGNSKNYAVTAQESILVTIVDDEHPLKAWIGTYTVAAVSYGSPGEWDEEWTITTSAIASDVTKLNVVGIAGSTTPVVATVNTTNMTIEMTSPSDLGAIYGYDSGSVYYATDEILAIASGYLTAGLLNAASSHKITGTIEANGTIKVDRMCIILDDYVYAWDCFNTTWTK
ncbi:MAG: hypothetical protein QUS66_11380 [Bacteroidota bacterium]|nr:hypothetical protein [Bacteroidota bacterium]